MKKLLVKLITIYQVYLSLDRGLLAVFAPGGACRYEVSCSEFTKRAIIEKGVIKGMILGVRRIISCR